MILEAQKIPLSFSPLLERGDRGDFPLLQKGDIGEFTLITKRV
jgi:hypothetical protein